MKKKLYEQPLIFQSCTLDKSLYALMSHWTKVFLDLCPWVRSSSTTHTWMNAATPLQFLVFSHRTLLQHLACVVCVLID